MDGPRQKATTGSEQRPDRSRPGPTATGSAELGLIELELLDVVLGEDLPAQRLWVLHLPSMLRLIISTDRGQYGQECAKA